MREHVSGDSARRQIEINEWQYSQKLETLFLYQLAFIAISFLVILGAASHYGIFSKKYVVYVGFITLTVLATIWFMKSMYTRNARDHLFWSRRTFSGDGKLPSNVSQSALAATAAQMNQMCQAQQQLPGPSMNCPTPVGSTGPVGSYGVPNSAFCTANPGAYDPYTGAPCYDEFPRGPTGSVEHFYDRGYYTMPRDASGNIVAPLATAPPPRNDPFARWGEEEDDKYANWLNGYRDRGGKKFSYDS
jgi:hypothetical protein